MKRKIYGKDGIEVGEIELPKIFEEPIRPELIKRAALSDYSKEFQPKGNNVWAGMMTSAKYRGRKEAYASLKNRGQPMLPRTVRPKGRQGDVRKVPQAFKGRRAHPPKVEKKIIEKINKKEYRKALHSAIAATANSKFVGKRGHDFKIDVPIIFDDSIEQLSKTKDIFMVLNKLIKNDLMRAKRGRKKRTTRKGGYIVPKSVIIIAHKNSKLIKIAKNIPGVDVSTVETLKVNMLAPGANPGRLAVFTKEALKELNNI